MNVSRRRFVLLAALLCISLSPGCGGGMSNDNNGSGGGGNHHQVPQVTSVMVVPATADAQDFPNGTVQFHAEYGFSSGDVPILVTPNTWCVAKSANTCAGINDVTGVVLFANVTGPGIVNGTGVEAFAQCSPGFTGQVTILAGFGASNVSYRVDNPPAFPEPFGSAILTCP